MSRAPSIALLAVMLIALTAPVAASEGRGARQAPPAAADPIDKTAGGAAAVMLTDRVAVAWTDAAVAGATLAAEGLRRIATAPAEASAALHAADVVATAGRPVADVLAELRADPGVAYAEPIYEVRPADVGSVTAVAVNDTKAGVQYSLDRMRVRDAWSLTTGAGNMVAVLDTGVSFVHADLAGRVASNAAEASGTAGVDDDRNGFIDDTLGWDFVNGDGDPRDDNQHGTWVAGIIAANANNAQGIAGISWSDRILAVKIMNANGIGDTAALSAGIRYAANRGAKVINMSVGGFPYSQAVADAVAYAWSKGAVLIGAAGNNRLEESYYPASYLNVVSVSATQTEDGFAHWSSYGGAVDVAAPGADIWTTHCQGCSTTSAGGTGYAWVSGTSFATPNVSGVVALIRARYPTWTNQQVVERLLATVDDLGFPGRDNRFGQGRVNAYRAVGGSVASVASQPTDALENNNTFAAARTLAIGSTYRPSINPAGDADYYAFATPRAGRLSVAVGAVADANIVAEQRSSWSTQPVDPIVELYDAAGTLLQRVDNPTDSLATEVATIQVAGSARVVVRISNWFPNGSPAAYALTATYLDNIAPKASGVTPAAGSVTRDGHLRPTVTWDEPVTGVSATTLVLRAPSGAAVPATVTYAAAARRATLVPLRPLAGEVRYTLTAGSGIKDGTGNAMAAASWPVVTGRVTSRLAGADRYATAAAISRYRFDAGVAVAYVASGADFADALAAGPAAGRGAGPVLLVAPSAIPGATADELIRLRPGRIVVVGGVGAVNGAVLAALDAYTAGTVTRLSGPDRYGTAAAISATFAAPGVATAYVAAGSGFADALAGGAVAARDGAPILLTEVRRLPPATVAELTRLRPARIVVLGGSGVVSETVLAALGVYTAGSVTRLAGADRYATAVASSRSAYPANGPSVAYLATGVAFPDGLAAAPVAGLSRGPLLLVPGTTLPPAVADELRRLDPSTVIILGSVGAVSDGLRAAVQALW